MKSIAVIVKTAAIGIFATNIAIAAPSPVEKTCSSSMDTMISIRAAMRNGRPKEKVMEIATRKNPALPDKYNEFLSSIYLWAIKNSDLPEGEFRYDGNMYCYLEYDRLKI